MQKKYTFGHWLIRILVCTILPLVSSAQSFYFEQHGKDEGYTGGGNYGNSTMLQDRSGYMWFATINGLNRFDGQHFKAFQYDHYDRSGISSNEVTALVEDAQGYLWIGTTDGLNRFDPASERFVAFHPDPDDPGSIAENVINHLLIDQKGRLWVSTRKTLNLYLPESGTFKHFSQAEKEADIPPLKGILHLAEGADGHIWIADNAGLFRFNPQAETFSCYYQTGNAEERYHTPRVIYKDRKDRIWVGIHFKGLALVNEVEKNLRFFDCPLRDESGTPDYLIESIKEDSRGVFWIGTRNGLYQFAPAACDFTKFVYDPMDPKGLLPGEVMDIYQDRQEVFWLMNWAQNKINSFAPYQSGVKLLTDEALNGISAVNDDTFLLATKKELWLFDRENKSLSKAIPRNHLEQIQPFKKSSTYFRQVLIDKTGKYLVGTFGGGLYVINPKSGETQHLLGEGTIYKMISLQDGRIFISASGNLFLYEPATGRLSQASDSAKFSKLEKKHCLDIYQDKKKNLWLGTAYNGLYLYHFQKDTILHFLNDHDDPNSLSSNLVRRIFEAKDGKFWFCTGSGLDEYDPEQGTFRHFSAKDGIESSTSINALTQDNSGLLWFTTTNSLYRFDPVEGTATKTFERDVLSVVDIPPTFHQQKNDDGIYFSSYLGLSRFRPEALKQKNRILGLVFTDLKLFNQSVEIGAHDSILRKKIAYTEALHLKHHQNNISITYQSISFKEPGLINYAYKLEGFDEDWQEVGSKKEATYTNLNPGVYTFRVKARYQNEAWSEQTAKLQVDIALPWWETSLARILWLSIFLTFSFLLYRFLLSRQLERAEAKQLKEIHNFKNQLYTSITHEFRTPITVILGITEHVKEKWKSISQSRAEQHLEMISRSGKGLLKLVNQMLDLSRIEANKMELVYIQGEIISYLSYLLEAMESLAETRDVRLKKQFEIQRLEMDYDPDKLQIVLANLLSNAIKFTPSGGEVSLQAKKIKQAGPVPDHLVLEVSDTGIGIAPENLGQIFQPFFQVAPDRDQVGTGIGLSLTLGLVELMGGSLSVASKPGQGSVFTLQLPIRKTAPRSTTLPTLSIPDPELEFPDETNTRQAAATGKSLPLLLLIEDNSDLIRYLQECLQDSYQVNIARDGAVGVEQALASIPDVIISDVMMPKKDGFAVCKELKNDERTSHIPIILLTAKATMEDRLSGLARGADAYLIKPFHKQELLIRLEQLVTLRKALKKRYTGEDLIEKRGNALEQIEDTFISKVNKIILDHLDDTDFDSAKLCQALLISNTQLYRKLKALTGESIAVYIRSVRLHQAKQLLVESDLNISEIAYQVGFKDLSYFSKCFIKKFAISPQNFRKKINA